MKSVIVAAAWLLVFSSQAVAMSVDEAYRAIPHQRTIFDARSAGMSAQEAAFLNQFFGEIDQAIVARVQTLQWFQSGGGQGAPFRQYKAQIDAILGHMKEMPVPARLTHVCDLVVKALQEQRGYFTEWQAAKDRGNLFQPRLAKGRSGHPLIQSSSQKLVEAYNELVKLYPQATPHNKQAFFDYLCALDFV